MLAGVLHKWGFAQVFLIFSGALLFKVLMLKTCLKPRLAGFCLAARDYSLGLPASFLSSSRAWPSKLPKPKGSSLTFSPAAAFALALRAGA